MFSRFYKDDATGLFSSTQLRTNILFTLFVLFAIVLLVLSVLVLFGVISSPGEREIRFALDLLTTMGIMSGVGGGLYLGKRVSERKGDKNGVQ